MYFITSDLKKIRHETIELIVSLFFATCCLSLFWLLPTEIKGRSDIIEILLRSFLFLVVFPILYIRIILKKSFADMYIGKYQYVAKANLPIIFSFAIGLFSIILIATTFLGEYYISLTLTKYISINFWAFVLYEMFIVIFYLFFILFSFGFINFITEKYNRLNKILPIVVYYFLALSFFKISTELLLIVLLMTLPTLFFKKIVNASQSIWSLYILLLILNIIFNTTIIKLSL